MPNINLTDSRKRDAVVKAESVRINEPVRYVGPKGGRAYTRRVLKATVDHDYATLVEQAGSPEKLGQDLVAGDPEIDMERFGTSLWNLSRVYTDPEDALVFRIEQFEVVRGPFGRVKERRPRERDEANVDADVPLKWTGTMLPKAEAYRKFVFSSKLQIVHVNGLTFDFLFGMAEELHKANSVMLLGGGRSGKQPLVFRRGSTPYRGFLEGRVDGKNYILLLHLSNMELKPPPEPPADIKADKPAKADAKKPAVKKTAAKKKAVKKTKSAAKPKADVAKKAASKKTAAKKTAAKKTVAKKAVPEKAAPKKAAAKKPMVVKPKATKAKPKKADK